MDAEIPVLSGYLIVPNQSGFSLNRISKKKSSNLKYCLLFRSSRHGIERLEICDSKDDLKNSKIITLENCVKITQDPTEKLINIVTKTGTLQLNTQSDEDLTNWVTVLKSVAFRDKSTLGRNSAIEEDNDLYCPSFNDGVFNVKLIPSDTTLRCKLETGNYTLELAATELQLKKAQNENVIIAKWPYRYIRKYGYRDGKFTFEAGRKCDTGEGIFRLDNPNPQQIFRCMSSKMKTMKNQLKNGDTTKLVNNLIDTSCENQLNVAISMEAGSRSPIPPSQNNNSISSEFDSNLISPLNQSSASVRGFISSTDSLNNTPSPTTSNPVTIITSNNQTKTIPNKPPRQIVPRKFSNYEPIAPVTTTTTITTTITTISSNTHQQTVLKSIGNSLNSSNSNNLTLIIPTQSRDYECIENITEAWKTLGLNEVNHTEHVTTPEDDLIEFITQRARYHQKKSSTSPQQSVNGGGKEIITTPIRNSPPPIPPPKLGIDEIDPDGNYDRLNFFKTNHKKSESYKTIIPHNTYRKQISQPITSNDYELVGGPDTQPCRMADDSYLGYGKINMVRKPSLPAGQITISTTNQTTILDDDILDHRSCNGLDYAIVSKPKRV